MKASLKSVVLSGGLMVCSTSVATNGTSNGPATWLAMGSGIVFIVSLFWWALDK